MQLIKTPIIRTLRDFLQMEAAGGIVLMAVAVAAMLLANSPMAGPYEALLATPLPFAPFDHWVNDGLMAVFFLMVGLEIKREIIEGELSTRACALLPVVAALGGVATPALIYLFFNGGTDAARGWAVPTATDIAFSLGVLSLFGRRVPASLKVFLMALAIIDDLAAVAIIAFFYTSGLNLAALAAALVAMLLLLFCNRRGVGVLWPYLLIGALLWFSVLQSGVHATVAGVLLAWLIPLPLGRPLIHALHPWVAFGVMPLFAFANAGVPLSDVTMDTLTAPLPLGIALGLFLGKQLGIFGASWLLIRSGRAKLPDGATWPAFYAVCLIAGIGFTMSLFIGTLAFAGHDVQAMRLGVMAGSLLSVAAGAAMLAAVLRRSVS